MEISAAAEASTLSFALLTLIESPECPRPPRFLALLHISHTNNASWGTDVSKVIVALHLLLMRSVFAILLPCVTSVKTQHQRTVFPIPLTCLLWIGLVFRSPYKLWATVPGRVVCYFYQHNTQYRWVITFWDCVTTRKCYTYYYAYYHYWLDFCYGRISTKVVRLLHLMFVRVCVCVCVRVCIGVWCACPLPSNGLSTQYCHVKLSPYLASLVTIKNMLRRVRAAGGREDRLVSHIGLIYQTCRYVFPHPPPRRRCLDC